MLDDEPLFRLLQDFPVRVTETPEAGRRLVASRDLAAGELVLASRPIGRVVAWPARRRWCCHCHGLAAEAALKVHCPNGCGLCFCSAACRRSASAQHTPAWCALRAALRAQQQEKPKPRLNPELSMLAQLLVDCLACDVAEESLLRVEPGGAAVPQPRLLDLMRVYTPSTDSLAAHGLSAWTESWREVGEAVLDAAAAGGGPLAPLLARCGGDQTQLLALLAELASKDLSNSFGLWDRTSACSEVRLRSGGHAIYPAAALLNHSCLPSVYHVHELGMEDDGRGAVLVCRALYALTEGDELTIRYVDAGSSGDFERRKLFDETWGFSCVCLRCVGDEAARAEAAARWDDAFLCGCGYGRPDGGPGPGMKPRARSSCDCPTPGWRSQQPCEPSRMLLQRAWLGPARPGDQRG
jgi:hypothetical protein